ncbi:MAG: UDP-3-O-(3-hydroxymyristoyl)glucosamine N-acyltransferase [Litoreibacter sp.]|nr:UDP-3-O-(3-hydroxymyristoyl)glucosamine N-acyltransferase [Litoreibacter sp.]
MDFSVSEIATSLGADLAGDATIRVRAAAEPASAGPDDLAVAMDLKYAAGLEQGQARVAILWAGADWQALGLKAAIFVVRPRYAMSGLTRLMDPGPDIAPGIHPMALIDDSAEIGDGAAIGPFVVIGKDVRIGARARVASHVSIAENASIGDDALILQSVRIGARVRIGDGFIAQPGAIVGADGFSFVTPEKSGVEKVRETLGDAGEAGDQSWIRTHSLGAVSIGNNVEIGANSTIDRGTIRDTSIGDGTKLDNLVHLGHNVTVGRDCLLCGQVGVAGSSKLGDRVVLAGQCGVNDNIFVGDDVIAGGGTKIFTNAPKGRVLLGYPAVKMDAHIEIQKALRRLPRFMKSLQQDK